MKADVEMTIPVQFNLRRAAIRAIDEPDASADTAIDATIGDKPSLACARWVVEVEVASASSGTNTAVGNEGGRPRVAIKENDQATADARFLSSVHDESGIACSGRAINEPDLGRKAQARRTIQRKNALRRRFQAWELLSAVGCGRGDEKPRRE